MKKLKEIKGKIGNRELLIISSNSKKDKLLAKALKKYIEKNIGG